MLSLCRWELELLVRGFTSSLDTLSYFLLLFRFKRIKSGTIWDWYTLITSISQIGLLRVISILDYSTSWLIQLIDCSITDRLNPFSVRRFTSWALRHIEVELWRQVSLRGDWVDRALTSCTFRESISGYLKVSLRRCRLLNGHFNWLVSCLILLFSCELQVLQSSGWIKEWKMEIIYVVYWGNLARGICSSSHSSMRIQIVTWYLL